MSRNKLIQDINDSIPIASVKELARVSARVLVANGQTTQRTIEAIETIGLALGYEIQTHPNWSGLTLIFNPVQSQAMSDTANTTVVEFVQVSPLGVDMNKVSLTLHVIEKLKSGQISLTDAQQNINKIAACPPASTLRFVMMAGLGAAALAIIFGVSDQLTLLMTFISASIGAALRRFIAKHANNPFAQPLVAAFLAGLFGALTQKFQSIPAIQFVEVCPCMILVPGAHIINTAIDLARGRIDLGSSRLAYSALIILMICVGLLLGLTTGGASLAPVAATHSVSIFADVLAAGVAVAAFGAFFSMPWRILFIPVFIGMFAHSLRWFTLQADGTVVMGTALACFFASVIATPLSHKLKLPFAALAFASVVSMMPGVFLFRMSSALVEIFDQGPQSDALLLSTAASDGLSALLICLAITFGLIIPKLVIDRYYFDRK